MSNGMVVIIGFLQQCIGGKECSVEDPTSGEGEECQTAQIDSEEGQMAQIDSKKSQTAQIDSKKSPTAQIDSGQGEGSPKRIETQCG